MKRALLVAAVASCVAGPTRHYSIIAKRLAAGSCQDARVVPAGEDDRRVLYRVDACGDVSYVACWYTGVRSRGLECCRPAPEPGVVDLFRFEPSSQSSCEGFDDD